MLRKLLYILTSMIVIVSLSGCYDINEVDNMLHALVIGVDKGVSDRWRLSIQFPTLKEGSEKGGGMGKGLGGQGGDTGSQGGYSVVTVDAPSFYTGIDMLNTSLPRRINLMHAEFLVVSEDFAKSGLLGEYIAPMVRFRQTRRTMRLIISKGPAFDFIMANKATIGSSLSKDMELSIRESGITGFFPDITLNSFYEGLKSSYNQPTAILGAVNNFKSFKLKDEKTESGYKTGGEYTAGELPRAGENKLELFGTAVFDGGKMVGELTGDETRLMLIAKGDFKTAFWTIQDPESSEFVVVMDVRQAKKPYVKVSFNDDKPVINLKAYLEGDIMSVQSRINYESPELKPVLENAIEQHIKDGLDKLMIKSKSLKSDVLDFGIVAVKQFGTIQEWEDYNWLKHFKDAGITTEVEFNIRRSGTQLKSSPIYSTEGKK